MAQALEAGDDPLAEFLAWHARQLERDNAEGRGPALTAPRCVCGPDSTGEAPDCRSDCPEHGADGGAWAATAAAWPPNAPPPF